MALMRALSGRTGSAKTFQPGWCEIKLTKTPKLVMADPVARFKKLFPKLKIGQGTMLCLAEEHHALTRDVDIQTLPKYWRWLRTVNEVSRVEEANGGFNG